MALPVAAQQGSDTLIIHSDPALFLEPNRFSIVKDLDARTLWLKIGYGRPFAQIGDVRLGLEALGWSRLRLLSDFRFPVETADYFFGAFAYWGQQGNAYRFRLSHISSHDVDGKATVTGGSSSHYSREFVELSREISAANTLDLTLGARVMFHQVTKIEPWISFPCALQWKVLDVVPMDMSHESGSSNSLRCFAFLSTGDGPVWPNLGGGIRVERLARGLGATDLEILYQRGASWAGTDAALRMNTLRIQLTIRDL
jgi:hypothetical protein